MSIAGTKSEHLTFEVPFETIAAIRNGQPEALKEIIEYVRPRLASNQVLTTLDFSCFGIASEHVGRFAQAIQLAQLFGFSTLSLKDCEITDDTLLPLLLAANEAKFRKIELDSNRLSVTGYRLLFSNLGNITHLRIQNSNISDDDCLAFEASLSCASGLKVLDLRNNQLADASLGALSNWLSTQKKPMTLLVRKNLFSQDGFVSFVDRLAAIPNQPHLSDLQTMATTPLYRLRQTSQRHETVDASSSNESVAGIVTKVRSLSI